ncbi:MAG TPA: FAD-binding oxidoreductase [Solirubrobacteraceae bacterium]|nr:FAD-binding oxidoreductase [Solirubrobacteraceae bacterium]
MTALIAPAGAVALAAALGEAARERRPVRIAGSGSKGRWGAPPRQERQILLSTQRLDEIRHHREDRIAEVGAGVPLGRLQSELAQAGQMLALDPPLGERATVGGIIATGDSGPLSHRFGTPRDLILGARLALPDGRIVDTGAPLPRRGSQAELTRLLCGSFGLLGVVVSVTVRLVPLPARTATALGLARGPHQLAAAARSLAAGPLELMALDYAWRGGRGGLLAQTAGPNAVMRAQRAAAILREQGLGGVEVTAADNALWARQRAGQRSSTAVIARVHTAPSQLAALLGVVDAVEATAVGRAGTGVSYLELDPARLVELVRLLPSGSAAQLLDHPAGSVGLPTAAATTPSPAVLALMRSLKRHFDPHGICNPGLSLGGVPIP